ncbi:protein transport protein sec31-like [Sorghum bicolor]|uniref:protein transport protein sec31-like n=1 Tax=Sorghum bicolor TaxID=4558 RepID=UPI000B424918|nr:protein transport protein sec31-like [Sorghum bicolor]|eukprot:XP_021309132.1 protein transport protein sec31-like [Sorghum bicolor]
MSVSRIRYVSDTDTYPIRHRYVSAEYPNFNYFKKNGYAGPIRICSRIRVSALVDTAQPNKSPVKHLSTALPYPDGRLHPQAPPAPIRDAPPPLLASRDSHALPPRRRRPLAGDEQPPEQASIRPIRRLPCSHPTSILSGTARPSLASVLSVRRQAKHPSARLQPARHSPVAPVRPSRRAPVRAGEHCPPVRPCSPLASRHRQRQVSSLSLPDRGRPPVRN